MDLPAVWQQTVNEEPDKSQGAEERIVRFVVWANWATLAVFCMATLVFASLPVFFGVLAGGLIACGNFHLLSRTLRNAFRPGRLDNYHTIIAKYYVRFFVSALVIMVLIALRIVNPLGLFLGLSVVVSSIIMALVAELKHHIG